MTFFNAVFVDSVRWTVQPKSYFLSYFKIEVSNVAQNNTKHKV